jgi:hypothetical protein
MATVENYDGPVNAKMLGLFLLFGAIGAIVMSWISYSLMIGRAL